jgi:glutathione S-transferase
MITLHYYPGNASFAPHVLLHELGVPFELSLVDRTQAAHKTPAYLKLNPNGLIPVLVDGDLVLYETAAICLHLADIHPAAALAPPFGSIERAHCYKWLMWLTNTVQANLIHYFYGDRLVDAGNAEGAAQVKAHAQAKVAACLEQIDGQLASHGGPWLMGPAVQPARRLHLDGVPMDARFQRHAGARVPAHRAFPAAHGAAAGHAARHRYRETVDAAVLASAVSRAAQRR